MKSRFLIVVVLVSAAAFAVLAMALRNNDASEAPARVADAPAATIAADAMTSADRSATVNRLPGLDRLFADFDAIARSATPALPVTAGQAAFEPGPEPVPVLERIESFGSGERLDLAVAAYRISRALGMCRLDYQPMTGQQILEAARLRYDEREQWVTQFVAQAEKRDPEVSQAMIDDLASLTPQQHIERMVRAERIRQSVCAGTERMSHLEREWLADDWLARAASLGHPQARMDYLNIFIGNDIRLGQATRIAEQKRTALGYLAEALARHDPRVLGILGDFAGYGYFARPDPELALAFYLADRAARRSAPGSGWRMPDWAPEISPLRSNWIDRRIERLQQALAPDAVSAARDASRRMLDWPERR